MKSSTTADFRKAFARLPNHIQRQARSAYRLFQESPRHPSLRFKKVDLKEPIYSVRISRDYRALGVIEEDEIIWFWIGSHADYERMIT